MEHSAADALAGDLHAQEEVIASTIYLREKIRAYSIQHREKLRADAVDAFRFGLGEIQAEIKEINNLTVKDVHGLATRIKRRKHATTEDMYRLSHAFLQCLENIRAFANIPGAIQVLIKEVTGNNSERLVSAVECLCNFSLGEPFVCEKIANMSGSYLVTYLDSTEERLKRTSLWTIGNILFTCTNGAKTLIQMELVPKLWSLYVEDNVNVEYKDYRKDAAICLQLISNEAKNLLRRGDREFIYSNITTKNPTGLAGEYHLQILFNCDIVQQPLNEKQILYLINYAISNFSQTSAFVNQSDRLRILYAVRLLSNLLAFHKTQVFNNLLEQVATVWHTNLANILNKIFGFGDTNLTKETYWLVKNLLQQEELLGLSPNNSFLHYLEICRVDD